MNTLSDSMRLVILKLLVEGNSISSVSRITGVHRDTCSRLMVWFGQCCRKFLDREIRDLTPRHVEVDEIHTFVRKKDRAITGHEIDFERIGSIFIHVALDQDTRLIPAYRVGRRDQPNTEIFIADLASRIQKPNPHVSDGHAFIPEEVKPVIQISSDGWQAYPQAIDMHFGGYADYAQVIKEKYKDEQGEGKVRMKKRVLIGEVKDELITTSLVERNNLTIRTFMRRLMRRTLGFSKKFENLDAATAVHIAHYNYCWKHKTLKTSPAHRAGLAPRRLTLKELFEHVRVIGVAPSGHP